MSGQPQQSRSRSPLQSPLQSRSPSKRALYGGSGGCGLTRSKFHAIALGLILACFVMMCTNAVLFVLYDDDGELYDYYYRYFFPDYNHLNHRRYRPISPMDARMVERSSSTIANAIAIAKTKTKTKTKTAKHSNNNNNNSKNNNSKNKKLVYECSYGPTRDERTTVTVPIHTPTFVVIGVQKSGSTAMLTHFRDHPQMLQTKHKFRREGHFFDTYWYSQVLNEAARLGITQANDKHCLALQQYMKLFETETMLAHSQTLAHARNNNNKKNNDNNNDNDNNHDNHENAADPLPLFTFEKTMMYVMNPKIPARIKLTVPWAKVVLVLRNPVDRLYSQYKMLIRDDFKLRDYSLEDLIYHELKAMKGKFSMTNAPLPVPLFANGTAMETETETNNINNNNNNNRDPSIPVHADHYRMPESIEIPPGHLVSNSQQWKPPKMAMIKKPDNGPFRSENFVRRGLYAAQLEWWLEHYTVGEDLLVVNYQDLLEDTRAVYERVLRFVDIPLPSESALEQIDFAQKVRADDRKNERPLSEATRKYLAAFYAPSNARLGELLGPEWTADKLRWE